MAVLYVLSLARNLHCITCDVPDTLTNCQAISKKNMRINDDGMCTQNSSNFKLTINWDQIGGEWCAYVKNSATFSSFTVFR